MTWKTIEKKIHEKLDSRIQSWYTHNPRRIYIDIAQEDIEDVARFLFSDLKARFIIASAVDTPRGGIEILYHFDFARLPQVISVRIFVMKPELKTKSIASIIKGAEWIEREIAELFGVTFENHPNPVHLLLPEDWPEGKYPLRRDQ